MRDLPNLDECRGAGDFATALTDIRGQITDLEAEADGRPFNDEQRDTYAELQKLEKAAAASKLELEQRATYVGSLATDGKPERFDVPMIVRTHTEADIYDFSAIQRLPTQEQRDQGFRDNAMRATEKTKFPNPTTDTQKSLDKIGDILDNHDSPDKRFAQRILATGSPVYKRAFNKMLAAGNTSTLTPEEQRGTALAVGVDGTGGFAVPFAFDPTVIAIGSHTGAINPYRANCRVVPIVGTDTWNPVTATAVVAARATEAAASNEQGPTFAQGVNGAYIVKRVQTFVTYSMELGQDRPDLASEISMLFSEAKDNEEENQFCVGIGTGVAPLGVMPPSGTSNIYTSIQTASGAVIVAADLYGIEAALPVRWRFGARWVMNRGNLRKMQALETTGGILFQNSQYFPSAGNIDISPTGNTGLKLLGYPVDESPSAPTSTATTIRIATLFAPQTFIIVDRIGMTVELVPQLWATGMLPLGNRGVYAMWRNTAAPLLVDAGRTLFFQ